MIKYKRLKTYQHGQWVDSNEWGLEITGTEALSDDIEAGDVVEVRKANGTTRLETIGRIISRKDDSILCTIDRKGLHRPIYSEINYREGRCGEPFPLY
jgi:hypothetical protein